MRKCSAFLFSLVMLLAACTDNEQFRVNGIIEGNPTINLRVAYYSEGAYRTQITAAREGKFEFYGSSKQPTLVEITDYEYRPLARIYASNGETFEIEIDRAHLLAPKITGNDISERWSSFLKENEEAMSSPQSANSVIERYVAGNPADILSTLLMVTAYDASADAVRTDSIMGLIDPKARPSTLTESLNYMLQRLITESVGDTISTLRYANRVDSVAILNTADKPLTLITLSQGGDFRDDSIAPALTALAKNKRLNILEIDIDPRSNTLKGRSDTLAWKMGRVPGGLAGEGLDRLGIPSVPFFIVTDSCGAQLLRTASPGTAKAFIKAHSKP